MNKSYKTDHFGMRKIQTVLFFTIVLLEAFALVYLHTDLHYKTRVCEDMIGLTFVFMSIVQYLWLEQYEKLAFITCGAYFFIMVLLLYYSTEPLNYVIFASNMLILTNVVVVRKRKLEKEGRNENGNESK